jgi:AbrB family looped-hinge helix DNA binding protein
VLSTLTSKGQITLPKAIRDRLHLRSGDRVQFLVLEDGRVELVPVTAPLTRLKGMLPAPPEPVTLEQMDAAVRQRAGRS